MDISEFYSLHPWRKKDRQKSTAAVDSGEASSAMMMAAGLQPTPPTLQTAMVAEPGSTPGPPNPQPLHGNLGVRLTATELGLKKVTDDMEIVRARVGKLESIIAMR